MKWNCRVFYFSRRKMRIFYQSINHSLFDFSFTSELYNPTRKSWKSGSVETLTVSVYMLLTKYWKMNYYLVLRQFAGVCRPFCLNKFSVIGQKSLILIRDDISSLESCFDSKLWSRAELLWPLAWSTDVGCTTGKVNTIWRRQCNVFCTVCLNNYR